MSVDLNYVHNLIQDQFVDHAQSFPIVLKGKNQFPIIANQFHYPDNHKPKVYVRIKQRFD
jgi:hypothetical protein